MLTLLLGRAGTGKSESVLHRLGECAETCPQLLLVPEQYSHDTERRLCKALGNIASNRAEVLSFSRLYHYPSHEGVFASLGKRCRRAA